MSDPYAELHNRADAYELAWPETWAGRIARSVVRVFMPRRRLSLGVTRLKSGRASQRRKP